MRRLFEKPYEGEIAAMMGYLDRRKLSFPHQISHTDNFYNICMQIFGGILDTHTLNK